MHPLTRANYLASPPLVVAYALAGTVSVLCAGSCIVGSFRLLAMKCVISEYGVCFITI